MSRRLRLGLPAPGLLVVAVLLGSTPAAPQTLELPDNPLQGRLLFESKRCVQCHAIEQDRGKRGPTLDEDRFSGSFLDLGADLWNHVPGMSVSLRDAGLSWPSLTSREATDLLAFLYFIDYLGRAGDVARGRELFQTQGCIRCHGLAEGPGREGPDLSHLRRFASPLMVASAIWNHGPGMLRSMRSRGLEPPRFEEGDLADLSAFLRQQGDAGPRERILLSPGNPNRGGELFAAKGCSVCHGQTARGGDGGPDLATADLHRSADGIVATMWNHALVMSRAMESRGVTWPLLETDELADLASFLYFLPFSGSPGDPARGAIAFEDRSCADCHGKGDGTQAPDLRAEARATSPSALIAAMWDHAPVMRDAILGEGRPWPELEGGELADLLAFLQAP